MMAGKVFVRGFFGLMAPKSADGSEFATEGCRAGSNIDKTQPRVSSAELNSAAGDEKGLERGRERVLPQLPSH